MTENTNKKTFDLVIFGASAYTGQFVIEELAGVIQDNHNNSKLTWAVAGRSQKKLQQALKKASLETGQDLSKIDTILADVNDLDSLKKMARQAKVILTIVGPYTLYGENVVKACVAEGTSCVDLSGEANFLEKMQIKYHAEAEKSGAYIVGACGFDSIPSDCGVTLLQDKFGGDLNSVEMYCEFDDHGKSPKTHFGTWYSNIQILTHAHELCELRKLLFSKTPPSPKYALEDMGLLHYSNEVKGWCVPFPGVDVDIVNRSQYNFYTNDHIWRPVQMTAYLKLPFLLCIFAIFGAYLFKFLCRFGWGRHILINYPSLVSFGYISHEGSTKEELKDVDCKFTLAGEGWSNKGEGDQEDPPKSRMNVVVQCKDPGYGATATMLVQSALTILLESDKIPSTGGVYPPGAAFAKTTLINRLNARGVTFTVETPAPSTTKSSFLGNLI